MKTKQILKSISLALLAIVLFVKCTKDDENTIVEPIVVNSLYKIESQFGNLKECDTLSKGNFLVWWDNDIDLKPQVSVMLDSMLAYRKTSVEELGMQYPDNEKKGVFLNIYVHRGNDPTDFFAASPHEFGNYVSNNDFELPYMSLPFDLLDNFDNTAHETFHVFQMNQNSPGLDKDDSQWYFEATADWFSYSRYPNLTSSFKGASMLTAIPEAPLWSFKTNFPDGYPMGWKRENHSYSLSNLLYYFSEIKKIDPLNITGSFYAQTNKTPQEYLYDAIGEGKMKTYFLDAAASMVNEHDFLTREQYQYSVQLMQSDDDQPDDNNQFVLQLKNEGTDDWFRPSEKQVTTAWSFNTVKLENTQQANYKIEFRSDSFGSYGDRSAFGVKVAVVGPNGTEFIDVPIIFAVSGTLNLTLTPEQTTAYIIIASTPKVFEDVNEQYQTFSYELKITEE